MVEVGTPGTNGDRHGPKFRTEPAFQFPAVNPSSLQASLCWKTKCCQANNPQHFLQTGIISCCRSVSLPSPLAVLDVHLIHVKLPDTTTPTHLPERTHLANLTVQESHLAIALEDLEKAQCELDAKQAELDTVQMEYEQAMREKQLHSICSLCIFFAFF
ncbi:uncharacterized protein [Hemitrygon akajei]|uniref:uncharacterized protein isoform X2 n=1 Tax=Hemitrygon akajei TaxID=2704970 RepID=UPI003BF9E423